MECMVRLATEAECTDLTQTVYRSCGANRVAETGLKEWQLYQMREQYWARRNVHSAVNRDFFGIKTMGAG